MGKLLLIFDLIPIESYMFMRLLLGKTLYDLRKGRKLSQAVVARFAAVSRPTYAGWEADRGCPTYLQVHRMLRLYNLTMHEISCIIEANNQETA